MEFKGTKGEWVISEINISDLKSIAIFSDEKQEVLLHMYLPNLEITEENKSNAKLIASAPDLLEALQEIQIDLSILKSNFIQIEKTDSRAEGMTDIIDKWIERNKKAIEKALK